MAAGRFPILCAAVLSAAATACAQTTVTWGGGFPDDRFSTPTNWVGGMPPLNDLTETLQFNDQQSNSDLNLDMAAFFAGISIQSTNGNTYQDITGSHSLTLGPGGIAISGVGNTYVSISFDVPIALAA